MRASLRFVILCMVTIFSTAIFSTAASAEDVKHVVLISADGLAVDYFDDLKAELPTLRMLDNQLPRVKAALSKLEGVQRVIEPAEFAALGLPLPAENHEAPHLILATGPGYSFNGDLTVDVIGPVTATYKGTHGHLPQPAYMHATFVAAGQGIRAGIKLKTVNNTDVAPTIARLMGLKLDSADGRVLREILKD